MQTLEKNLVMVEAQKTLTERQVLMLVIEQVLDGALNTKKNRKRKLNHCPRSKIAMNWGRSWQGPRQKLRKDPRIRNLLKALPLDQKSTRKASKKSINRQKRAARTSLVSRGLLPKTVPSYLFKRKTILLLHHQAAHPQN